ncbi:SDR family NAD(P)-dependent oxidoreductase [uncultured Tateyamaria sp.]|uniref:SDR family NAD(P)-dependent oxidoreductase n=1 Tax=uncultured Tateyamaria sp. TaxID=455651 RepID=UPI00261B2A45|nr:SDR family NAD(P)-dependent oxidoreductase [uncultured Tateyamaria sp.]
MSDRKIAVITGSTGGIGSAIADQLAASGWDLVLVNRSAEKSSQQKRDLNTAHPGAKVDLVQADLMDTDQIKRAAREILAIHSSIDALYNNSGVLTSQRVMSAQGHESNYAVNTLAPYVMLECLRPALKRTAGTPKTMIVNTTSAAHNAAKSLDVDMLSDPADIGGLTGVYSTTKLALTTMGTALAPDLEQDGIMVRSVCPGAVITPMTKTSDAMPGILKFFVPLLFNKPEKQAGKMINAAKPDSFGGRTGIYITNGKEKTAPKLAVDASVQASLMKKLSVDAAL